MRRCLNYIYGRILPYLSRPPHKPNKHVTIEYMREKCEPPYSYFDEYNILIELNHGDHLMFDNLKNKMDSLNKLNMRGIHMYVPYINTSTELHYSMSDQKSFEISIMVELLQKKIEST